MLILFLLSLAIPLILGVPVAFSLIISAIVLMSTKNLFTAQLVVQQFIGGINSFSLLAVPFFMLAGELMNKGGITKRIVDVVYIWVGRFPGRSGICIHPGQHDLRRAQRQRFSGYRGTGRRADSHDE